MAQNTRRIIIIGVAVLVLVLFAIGIIIGYFSRTTTSDDDSSSGAAKTNSVADAIVGSCSPPTNQGATWDTYLKRFSERHEKQACVENRDACKDLGLPRRYIAYHLNGKTINIDGQLNDEAWNEVPWTERFVDIRSDVYPAPKYETKMKIRWDDSRLYIGGYMQDEHLWSTKTTQDDKLHREHAVSMIMDVDGTMFNYKQVQINQLGTLNDLMLYKSHHDSEEDVRTKDWHPEAAKGVYLDGTVNNPSDVDKFWSFEVSFTFEALANRSTRSTPTVANNEVWFMQLIRTHWKTEVVGGQYQPVPNEKTFLTAWNPQDSMLSHLQDRWGLVQFKKDMSDEMFSFPRWHVYKALFDTMNAMVKYEALNHEYPDSVEDLDVPPYLVSGTCVDIPEIKVVTNGSVTDFDVSVKSRVDSMIPKAHVRRDKYVWFD